MCREIKSTTAFGWRQTEGCYESRCYACHEQVRRAAGMRPKAAIGPDVPRACTDCREVKPGDQFYWKRRDRGQRQTRCIDCFVARRRAEGALPKGWMRSDDARPCISCGVTKPASEFHFKVKMTNQRQSQCKPCQAADPARQLASWRSRLREYGLTEEQYDALHASQGGCCAICSTEKLGTTYDRLYVDHDHATGQVRGLLCMNCNTAIGHMRDDPELLRRAAAYIEAGPVVWLEEKAAAEG